MCVREREIGREREKRRDGGTRADDGPRKEGGKLVARLERGTRAHGAGY